ncbi:HAMP domain-containing sensor histidine kinase [Salinisphaera sp.]|uniref:sensor histidine kinase n=1 Tax=Salinisphaera sp. TaxID=1914330 RepID=UPI000C5F857E|nr:HAMP domain-containing sensor histidine kinase [Salinisphaera sp.]MBS61922.1 two-component sensor histidine kinase [Salinisphaera sp.]
MQAVFRLTPIRLLAWLHWLRWGAIACVLSAVAVAPMLAQVRVNTDGLLAVSAVVAAINALIGWSLRRPRPATQAELLAHLLLDVGALTAWLACTGGSSSAFVSLYLLPIAIAAAALPRAQAWLVAALAGGAYTALLLRFLYPASMAGHHGDFTLHVLGMWATFVVSAALLVIFVGSMASAVRRRDRSLAAAREQMLRNEQITAIGALAAGAAHELSTPLSTMSVIVSELRDTEAADTPLQADLAVLEQQLALCAHQIDQLLGAAEPAEPASATPVAAPAALDRIVARWRLMRPEIQATVDIDPALNTASLDDETALAQALTNVLNNAADASQANASSRVDIAAQRLETRLVLTIDDEGRGIADADTARAGRIRFSSKRDGRGLGLIVSHVSLERLGGEISLKRRPEGGTRTQVAIPLSSQTARS